MSPLSGCNVIEYSINQAIAIADHDPADRIEQHFWIEATYGGGTLQFAAALNIETHAERPSARARSAAAWGAVRIHWALLRCHHFPPVRSNVNA
jgi:hypothetical protein